MEKTIKKKILIAFLVIFLVSLSAILVLAYNGSKGDNQEKLAAKFIDKEKTDKGRSITINEQKKEIAYAYSVNEKADPDDTVGSNDYDVYYDVYDLYKDDDGCEYRFFYNTEKLCAFIDYNISSDSEKNLVDEKGAKQIADGELKKFVENYEDYRFVKTKYDSRLNLYYFSYNFYIQDYKTDDIIIIAINPVEKALNTFSCYKKGRFDEFASIDIDEDELEKDFFAKLNADKEDEVEIFEQFITMSDDGKLMMYYLVSNGEDAIRQKEILVPLDYTR